MIDLVAVVGPTAAGKTALGAALAERLGGEVVSADAFAVYRGLDVGTAKPPPELRARVPHHLVDIADPRERYSAGMFVADADAVIAGIQARRRLPVVVGGTLFYLRALLQGLFPEPPKYPALRTYLQERWRHDPRKLRTWMCLLDPAAASSIAARDCQRTVRALEVCLAAGRPLTALWAEHRKESPRYRALVLAVSPPRADLHARIARRVESMFAAGLLEEVRNLVAGGLPPEAHALKAIGYRECLLVLEGRWTGEQAREATVVATRGLARRQMTWLRGERGVVWLREWGEDAVAQAVSHVEEACGGTGTGPF